MAAPLPTTSTAPTAPAIPSPSPSRATRRELARGDVNAQLTQLLMHGFGTLTVKIHDPRITLVETTGRLLEGKGEEG